MNYIMTYIIYSYGIVFALCLLYAVATVRYNSKKAYLLRVFALSPISVIVLSYIIINVAMIKNKDELKFETFAKHLNAIDADSEQLKVWAYIFKIIFWSIRSKVSMIFSIFMPDGFKRFIKAITIWNKNARLVGEVFIKSGDSDLLSNEVFDPTTGKSYYYITTCTRLLIIEKSLYKSNRTGLETIKHKVVYSNVIFTKNDAKKACAELYKYFDWIKKPLSITNYNQDKQEIITAMEILSFGKTGVVSNHISNYNWNNTKLNTFSNIFLIVKHLYSYTGKINEKVDSVCKDIIKILTENQYSMSAKQELFELLGKLLELLGNPKLDTLKLFNTERK